MPSLIATLGANISGFVQDLNTAQGHAKKSGEGIGTSLGHEINSKLSSLLGAAAIEETIRRTVEYGSKVNDLALRLGISTDAIQQWDFALQQNGSSIEAAAGFFEKLAVNRDKAMKGSDAQIAAFQKLGITLDQLKNSRVEDIAATIAKAFQLGDPQALIGPLREVGGKSAGELVTAFRDGLADALKDAPLISPEDIAALDRAGDAWGKLKAEFQSSIAPVVAGITEGALAVIDFARAALAVPVGALMGVIEALQKTGGKIGLFGLGKAAFLGMTEALDAVSVQQGERDRADAERKARLAQPKVTVHEEDDSKAEEKARKDAERKAEADKKAQEKEADRAAKRAEQIEEQEWRREHNRKDEMPFKSREHINPLSSSGAFWGALNSAPQLAMLDAQKKSEQHLAAIKKGIDRISRPAQTSGGDDVQF